LTPTFDLMILLDVFSGGNDGRLIRIGVSLLMGGLRAAGRGGWPEAAPAPLARTYLISNLKFDGFSTISSSLSFQATISFDFRSSDSFFSLGI
jgi:hypothetical protein